MTNDYLVLTCYEVILFVKFSDIEKANEDQNYIEKLHEAPQIPVKLVDMRQMFDMDTIDAGLQIDVLD